jgi:3-dehydroquinate synthase
MEVSQLYNFKEQLTIRSKVKDYYNLNFIEDLNLTLTDLINDVNNIFVIDKNVHNTFNSNILDLLQHSRIIYINSGENSKTLDYIQTVIENLINLEIKRNHKIIAIGGGVTQDIVAFISTILFRGIDWIFLPTTLLAQCDSCIGSKSSINFIKYKNLLGTFNPPTNIFIDIKFLNTLSDADIKSGIGEMYHYFLPFNYDAAIELNNKYDEILKNRNLLYDFIFKSLTIKKKIIEIDEFDKDIRHVFNYGHTFGHAIETITNYEIVHGQAITLGMDLANYISLKLNLINHNEFSELHKILNKNLPKFLFTDQNIKEYFVALSKDKKNINTSLGCILISKDNNIKKYHIQIDELLISYILEYSKLYSI